MMKEHDLQPPVEISAPPEQPHFDDTRAVLSAQPVVPLDEIDATVKIRRRLFVAGAFVLAMVLGAASAIVAAYVRWRNTPQVIATETTEEMPVEPEPIAQEDIQVPEVFVAPVEIPKRRSAPIRNADVAPARRESSGDKDEDLDKLRDAVLYEEWQERRARRVLRRERRRAERDNSRDLSNLDEIFEGHRRRRP